MSRQVVQDDVNLLVGGTQRDHFLEQGDEVAAGVARCGLAMNLAKWPCLERHTETTFRGGSTQTRGVRHVQQRAAEQDPGGPAPGWQSSHPHRTPRHVWAV